MDFKFIAPKSEEELRSSFDQNAFLMAGGTDLLVKMRIGKIKPSKVISTLKIPALHELNFDGSELTIGSTVTYTELLEFEPIKKFFPILYEAILTIGSPQIRNRGTLVGNVMNASPAGDGLLALYLLDARVELSNGKIVNAKNFITGPGKTKIENGDYVRSIKIRKDKWDHTYFEKVGQRTSMTISIASIGWMVRLNGETVDEMRIAFGSVAPTILRSQKIESFSKGKTFNRVLLDEISEMAFEDVTPIDDVRGSTLYRKRLCRNLIYRLVDFVKEPFN